MSAYTYSISQGVVNTAYPSYAFYNINANLVLNWPIAFQDSPNIVANIMDITTTAGLTITLPDSKQVSTGQTILINNTGVNSFNVLLNDGTTLFTVTSGQTRFFYLTNNTTTNGSWRNIPFGGGFSAVTSVSAVSASGAALTIGGSPITGVGTFTFTLGNDLVALNNFIVQTGIPSRTGISTWSLRTITAGSNIVVANGNGVAGNPTVALSATPSGLTSIGAGNLSIASNTLVSTDANGNINISPNGSGNIQLITVAPGAVAFGTDNISLPNVDGSLGDTMVTNGASVMSMATIPGRNRVINGDVQICQDAPSFPLTNNTTYGPDFWQIQATGGGMACTFAQVVGSSVNSFAIRAQRNNTNAVVGTIRISNTLTISQCMDVAAKNITVSFNARSGTNFSGAGNNLTYIVYSGTGVVDVGTLVTPFTGQATVATASIVLTNALTNYSFTTAALANNITQLAIHFFYTTSGVAGVNDYFDITELQIETGSSQTPFERVFFSDALNRCLAFYCKSFNYGITPVQSLGNDTKEEIFPATRAGAVIMHSQTINFPIYMIINNPVVTFYNPAAANANARDESIAADCSNTTTRNLSRRGFTIDTTGNAGTAVGSRIGVHWSSDARPN